MMIDLSTIYTLELIQNLQDPKSRDCLFGLLNQTQTPMGARLLRSNILQPLTNPETLNLRYDALEEITTKEDLFFGIKQGLWFPSRKRKGSVLTFGRSVEGFPRRCRQDADFCRSYIVLSILY